MSNVRKRVIWDRIKGTRAVSALLIATSFGAGLVPVAPGTAGTIVSIPICYFTHLWSWPERVALWILVTAIGTWSAKVFDEINETGDNQHIVIDETIGYAITAWTAGREWKTLLAAFVLFRFFDIVKIFPVRAVDKWSKTKGAWWGGFGVIADDMLAGVQGLIVILILQHFGVLPGSFG